MLTNFQKVGEFRFRFGLGLGGTSKLLNDQDFLFRFDLMLEELREILKAHRAGSVVEFADGLADLLYMVYGTAHEAGIPIDDVFDEVHRANMTKVRAPDASGARSSANDIVKPEGWVPPNVRSRLRFASVPVHDAHPKE